MAVRKVTRPSNQEEVTLILTGINAARDEVKIGIPQYNARFTFVRHRRQKERWVEISSRQALQPGIKADLHVGKSVFYGMAVWACAILNANRVLTSYGKSLVKIRREKISWNVFWRADDGDHPKGTVEAYCDRDACVLLAQMGIELDNMYAVPAEDTKTLIVPSEEQAIQPSPSTPMSSPKQLLFCK